MRASNFADTQKAFNIKQGESGVPIAVFCGNSGISQATFFNRKQRYSGLIPSDIKRLKKLENENARLKRIAAAPSLDKETHHEIQALRPFLFSSQPLQFSTLPGKPRFDQTRKSRWIKLNGHCGRVFPSSGPGQTLRQRRT